MRIDSLVLGLMLAWTAHAADPASASKWDRLSALRNRQTVRVYVRGGRVLVGTIHHFRPDGLEFLDPKKVTDVKRADIAHHDVPLGRRTDVELSLRDGRVLTGSVQDLDDANVWLVESRNLVQLKREDVVRVTAKARGLTAVIGGAALGGAVAISVAADKKGTPQLVGFAAIMSGGVGAGIGALVGRTVTIYEAGPRK